MLRFSFFDEFRSGPGEAERLRYLVGKDDVPASGRVVIGAGELVAEPATPEAHALAVQVDVPNAGRLTLQTCLLPNRERPYCLALELARHRVMLFLNALEEWQLSDLPPDHPAMRRFEKARRLFTEAVVADRDHEGACTREAAGAALEALSEAIGASEDLTMHKAQLDLEARFDAGSASDLSREAHAGPPMPAALGVALQNDQFADPLHKILRQQFEFVACPLRWDEMEREEGRYSFPGSDRWIEWAVRKAKIPVVGGPLVDLAAGTAPDWLHIWDNDYATLREVAYEHIKRVVTRYRKAVSRWIAVSGVNTNAAFGLTLEEMVDLTRLSVMLVRKLAPKAPVIVELDQPWGEHASLAQRGVPPLLYAELVKESGIAVDGFGVRVQMGDTLPGRSTRDFAQFACMLDALASLDRPVHVTAVGAPSQPISAPPGDGRPAAEHDPGYWRQPWSPDHQARWLARALTIALSKPAVQTVCWQTLYDTTSGKDMRRGGLISDDGHAKPALRRCGEIASAHRTHDREAFVRTRSGRAATTAS